MPADFWRLMRFIEGESLTMAKYRANDSRTQSSQIHLSRTASSETNNIIVFNGLFVISRTRIPVCLGKRLRSCSDRY